tara:strand:- start:780 stop:893 length:114 start_codon:yes stop_codon:yes gene_type:complete
MEGQQAGEFLDGCFVVVHADVNETIIEAGVASLGAHD